MRVLITGMAGFIGSHLAKHCLLAGHEVWGFDNLNSYYSPQLKRDRISDVRKVGDVRFETGDLCDPNFLSAFLGEAKPEILVHLAAQPGVRHSLSHPQDYVSANLVGFVNLLEACRKLDGLQHLLFASTSSVYGANTEMPYAEDQRTDAPLNLYAATKKSNELIAHAYAHLFGIGMTALRFFTVYGPWGRPDMAPHKFISAIRAGEPIDIHNNGAMSRDFTYVDDIVAGISNLFRKPPQASEPFRVINIGRGEPVNLLGFVEEIERCLGRSAKKHLVPIAQGEVVDTWCSTEKLAHLTGYQPETSLPEGIQRTVEWHHGYYPQP